MRAPAILFQCFPALLPNQRTSSCVSIVSDRDPSLPSPAVEILPPQNALPYKYAGERVDVQGLNIFKGRVSVADLIGFASSETLPSKTEGNLRYWESSINLVNVLKNEIRDGQLSFRGKKVLEVCYSPFVVLLRFCCDLI
ncbi:histidine protein methyltransferase 1 [Carex littledalei]|uniref:Histidine protein methyltransferase 1 n=1 Tax=Carex littledalei TaxID=544730 RepID=A0A833VFL1_9POAL|nr:histidine protein methyltransferase 1 [Carex littledalei]